MNIFAGYSPCVPNSIDNSRTIDIVCPPIVGNKFAIEIFFVLFNASTLYPHAPEERTKDEGAGSDIDRLWSDLSVKAS